MKIYVINLAEATQRMSLMRNQLEALGLAFTRFDAVRGSTLTTEQISQWCNVNAIESNPTWLTRGAIGCALSHWRVYQQIVQDKSEVSLILEDDMLLPTDFGNILDAITQQIKDNEVILLYFQSFTEAKFSLQQKTTLYKNYELAYPMDISRLGAAGAYIITQQVAQRLAERIFPISAAADTWHFFHQRKGFDTLRCVLPFVVTSSFSESTIDYIQKDNLLGKIKHFSAKYNLLFINDLLKWNRKKIWKKLTKYSFSEEASPFAQF